MAKLQRVTQKIFGKNAPSDDIAELGSFKTGTPVYTDNIATLQNAAYEEGYGAALVANEAPFLEEQNSVPYILSTQLAYNFQEGIPEYDANTTYYIGSIVKTLNEDNKPTLYYSLSDNNMGNPLTDTENWEELTFSSDTPSGNGFNLFDPVIKDHILSFEESKGLALQGTYVYKTGVAGSRYGYPDFIQKCSDEKTAGTASQVTLGDNTITMYTNANGHQFYDIADKDAVDAFYNSIGIAWFYGIDETNERVFLPRGLASFAYGNNLPVTGNGKPLTLTNGTTSYSLGNHYALYNVTQEYMLRGYTLEQDTNLPATGSNSGLNMGQNALINIDQDPEKSNAIVPLDKAVKAPAYLYICVGNTEVQTAVTNVMDITSSENDTLPLGYSTYQKGTQSSVAWLASNGQYNSGTQYLSFYNFYSTKIGQEFASGYVRNHTDEYTDNDLVINQDDQTFRLPLKADNPVIDEGTDSETGISYIVYNDGTCEQWGKITQTTATSHTVNLLKPYVNKLYNIQITSGFNKTSDNAVNYAYNIETNSFNAIVINVAGYTASWYTKGQLAADQYTPKTLYFKVGNAVQNLDLMNAGVITEALATKLSRDNKSEIVNWATPDFENGISIPTSYTTPSAGLVFASFTSGGNIGPGLTVNGSSNIWYDYSSNGSMRVVVGKGDQLVFTNTNNRYFYPLKGDE